MEMSFEVMHVTVDGSLSNPFVAVSLGILVSMSGAMAYHLVRVLSERRWGASFVWSLGLAAVVVMPDMSLHLVTTVAYLVHSLGEVTSVSLIGEHPAWVAPCAAPVGGVVGFLRTRRRVRLAT